MSEFKEFEVSFRTWNVKTVTVVAKDYDEAVDAAYEATYFDEGEEFEVLDVIEHELRKHDES
jgi:hypothetical protein